MVNPGPSPDEIRLAELEARIRPAAGPFKVGVMGKGGAGKTTVSACIGSVLAELRQEDRVVALDADTAFGKLGSRVDPEGAGLVLGAGRRSAPGVLRRRSQPRRQQLRRTFRAGGRATPARRRVLDPAIYREAISRFDRYFTISVIDCSSTMDTPVTQEVLRDLDALVVVSTPWVDGAAAAGQTLDWLAAADSDRAAAAHHRGPQRLRWTRRQAHSHDSRAAVRAPRPTPDRSSVRWAPAARRCDRQYARPLATDSSTIRRGRRRPGASFPDARRSPAAPLARAFPAIRVRACMIRHILASS